MNYRKKLVIPIVIMLIIGFSLVSNSYINIIRLVDIAQLIVFGMALGVLIANLKFVIRNKNQNS